MEYLLNQSDFVYGYEIERFNNNEIIYRIIYNKNPRKFFDTTHEKNLESLVDETVWGEVQNKLG